MRRVADQRVAGLPAVRLEHLLLRRRLARRARLPLAAPRPEVDADERRLDEVATAGARRRRAEQRGLLADDLVEHDAVVVVAQGGGRAALVDVRVARHPKLLEDQRLAQPRRRAPRAPGRTRARGGARARATARPRRGCTTPSSAPTRGSSCSRCRRRRGPRQSPSRRTTWGTACAPRADRHEVVGVERLDQRRRRVDPPPVPRHRLHRPRLVRELPRHDRRVVAVGDAA